MGNKRRHSLSRTSAKGQPFVGVCTRCGTVDLKPVDANEECPDQRGMTYGEVLIEAITDRKN